MVISNSAVYILARGTEGQKKTSKLYSYSLSGASELRLLTSTWKGDHIAVSPEVGAALPCFTPPPAAHLMVPIISLVIGRHDCGGLWEQAHDFQDEEFQDRATEGVRFCYPAHHLWVLSHLQTPLLGRFEHTHQLVRLAFSPSGEYVATGDIKGMITQWFVSGDQLAGTNPLTIHKHWHAHEVLSLSFNLEGTYMLSGGEEAVLVIWQMQSGNKVCACPVGPLLKPSSQFSGFR